MKITGLTLEQFTRCVSTTSRERYGGNVIVQQDAHDNYSGKPGCVARLTVHHSPGPGSRTTTSGRHGPYACWHAYRDVLAEVFTQFPRAVVTAGRGWRVTYRGAEGFLENYPATASVNIGSADAPVTMPELCNCAEAPRARRYNEAGQRIMTDADYTAGYARRYAERRAMERWSPNGVGGHTFVFAHRRTELGEPRYNAELDETRFNAEFDIRHGIERTELEPLGTFDLGPPWHGIERTELEPLGTFDLGNPYWDADPDRVSPAIASASRAYAASAKLLGEGDKPADPLVFGNEYAPRHDKKSYRYSSNQREF
jgi:hypothetical protein